MQTNWRIIFDLLEDIKGNGTFVSTGVEEQVVPGIRISGYGELGLPLNDRSLKDLKEVSHQAPFGKGSQTVLDTSVRSVREIDAGDISFHNPKWPAFLKGIVRKAVKGLGVEDPKGVEANLYKLLLYEKGDFFLPHKDSEKEDGMFGTLIIGLPGDHTGGELIVGFDQQEQVVSFSDALKNYQAPYVAFFADCEHEVKPVSSGYRICLVYNLIQKNKKAVTGPPEFGQQMESITKLLELEKGKFEGTPKVVLLGHEYTPANFSLDGLKGHDRPRTEALRMAADAAGYHSTLALFTHYQNGELEGVGYDYYYGNRDSPDSDGVMGEVYEEYSYIEYWSAINPGLGNWKIKAEEVITDREIGEGEPTEEEEERYTGNAGMMMEYWYHYAAVVLWPVSEHFSVLRQASSQTQLGWLSYYLEKNEAPSFAFSSDIREVLLILNDHESIPNGYDGYDKLKVVTQALVQLRDPKLIKTVTGLLASIFEWVEVEEWGVLCQQFELSFFNELFRSVGSSKDIFKIGQWLKVINRLVDEGEKGVNSLLLEQVAMIPEYIGFDHFRKLKNDRSFYREGPFERPEAIKMIIRDIIRLSVYKEDDPAWREATSEQITKELPRKYLNKVVVVALLDTKLKTSLSLRLKQICRQHLLRQTEVKPMPPKDWSREVLSSKSGRAAEVWEMLASFLRSPTSRVFEYKARKDLRNEVDRVIKSVTIDLKTETVHKGSPHLLRITKTQSAYERSLKYWEEDMQLLERLENE